jgi:hypothetical protein
MYVSLLMDVEDPIDPLSDDAAKECAEILFGLGVPGTFMVVGEKARKLSERGRRDAIGALSRHAVGLHSDMHSLHPVVLEYLDGLSWDDGVAEAVRREGRGVEAIRQVFGRDPCAWGGPGNLWGPQITEACRLLGMPAVVYAHTELRNRDMHRFLGVLHYTHGPGMPDAEYSFRRKVRARLRRLSRQVRGHADSGVDWLEIFLGHPTRIWHEDFWDLANFAEGRMPPEAEWAYAPRKEPDVLEETLRNFRSTVELIRDLPGIEIVNIDQANRIFGAIEPEPVSESEIEEMWPVMVERMKGMARWPILPRDCDVSGAVRFTRERLSTLQRIKA